MAITVSGTNPTQVTVASDTVTTNTTFNSGAPNDRIYQIADNIVGAVNAGVTVGGFGLILESFGGVAMTNNGAVIVNQPSDALILEGNGGAVTYAGSGIVSNAGAGRALFLDNSDDGEIDAVINNDITANTESAVLLNTSGDGGVATLTQAAGTLVSNTFGGALSSTFSPRAALSRTSTARSQAAALVCAPRATARSPSTPPATSTARTTLSWPPARAQAWSRST